MSANPNSGFKASEIPKEHMGRVLNSLLCERFLGFERRLTDAATFEWRGRKKEGWSDWSDALIDFAGDLKEAQHLLVQVCRQSGIGYNLIYDPRAQKHSVYLLGVGEGGQPVPIVTIEGVTRLPEAMAAAMCGFLQLDIRAQHKTLYPGNYLLLVS